ncbi:MULTISPECIES: HAD family hydrolase [unclassified Planococcus (in: firmicutes)]|uniref:HAD family hydrolase n=1 Tax=unclassified Planococcus (in: firmicutes) TaxID=2662419 RepID=UPI000C327921|nr:MULTISPECIES: HAD family hydrolase [unclassified Planococcus (in: firmicutes)]AUD14899.1 nucleosidase [Planococcus sp. MB-3u-03]PKG45222.1 nucleosidase [Planococcus sp. Urea-trap-24]PKG87564.1 nucleosidase [Planococcus sp. Urea-3u-39]PKH41555.1 nucleosidase [Planococcus sp. MB-3u-09]
MKAIIFDMDATLFQTGKILEQSLEEAFAVLRERGEWQGAAPIDEYRNIMGVPLPAVWEALLPGKSEETKREMDAYFLERLIVNISEGKGELYPDVKGVLAELVAEGYRVFIASNGLVRYLAAIVEYYGLNEWVTETFSIEQASASDKGELVRIIKEKYGVTEGAVVGDRLSDIRAAKANDLFAVGCRFDFAQEQELKEADAVIDNLADLREVLKRSQVKG